MIIYFKGSNAYEKEGYEAVIEVKDTNGNIIKVSNNEFEMPENDVTIKVTYNEKVNPKTGDHIFIYMSIFGLSIISLLGIRLYQIKRKDN
jgi:LPXTG-motif cell wall-anchored protein